MDAVSGLVMNAGVLLNTTPAASGSSATELTNSHVAQPLPARPGSNGKEL
jgi:hypothetical protein